AWLLHRHQRRHRRQGGDAGLPRQPARLAAETSRHGPVPPGDARLGLAARPELQRGLCGRVPAAPGAQLPPGQPARGTPGARGKGGTTAAPMINEFLSTWLHWLGGTPCFRIYGRGRRERDWRIISVYATHRRNADSRWPLWRGTCITWTSEVIVVGWDFAE